MKFLNGEVRWGIIGCGDVCEVKSGPAFSKVPNSKLVAVMRRDKEKAKDFASRHHVLTLQKTFSARALLKCPTSFVLERWNLELLNCSSYTQVF